MSQLLNSLFVCYKSSSYQYADNDIISQYKIYVSVVFGMQLEKMYC